MSIKGFNVNGVTDRYDYNYLDNKPEIHSIPTGGTAGQVLAKRSGADYAVEWADQTGGGGDITVDDVLSNTSENPVQNKVITAALATKADQAGIQQVIEDEVDDWLSVQAPSIGTLSYAAKQALLACFRHVAWVDDQGQSYYNALESELFPDATLESITAVFTQGSSVIYDTDSLDTLRQYLVVTATYSDSTTATVTDYTLSGTLTAGTRTITVSYGGKTDTFEVEVTQYWQYSWDHTMGKLEDQDWWYSEINGTAATSLEEDGEKITSGTNNSYFQSGLSSSKAGSAYRYMTNGYGAIELVCYGVWNTSSSSPNIRLTAAENVTNRLTIMVNQGKWKLLKSSHPEDSTNTALTTAENNTEYTIRIVLKGTIADVFINGVKVANDVVATAGAGTQNCIMHQNGGGSTNYCVIKALRIRSGSI